ncbi:MAG: hypothetical protein R2854_19640 [Caldilineaceae bacterium]
MDEGTRGRLSRRAAFATGYDLASEGGYAEFMDEVESGRAGCGGLLALQRQQGRAGQSSGSAHAHRRRRDRRQRLRASFSTARWDGIAMLLETPKDDDLADDVRNTTRLVGLVDDADRIRPAWTTTDMRVYLDQIGCRLNYSEMETLAAPAHGGPHGAWRPTTPR